MGFTQKPAADGKPCRLMHTMISQMSDGSLGGVRLWFAERHTRHCIRCKGALIGLVDLETRLLVLGATANEQGNGHGEQERSHFPASLRIQIGDALDRVDADAARQ